MRKREIISFMKKHKTIFGVLICSIIVMSIYIEFSSSSYMLKSSGQVIGIVKDKEQVNTEIEFIKNELKEKYNKDVDITNNITYEKIKSSDDELLSNRKIRSILYETLEINVTAYALKVNGNTLLYIDSKESMNLLLDRVKTQFIGEKKATDYQEINFVEELEVEETSTNINNIKTTEEALSFLLKAKNEIKIYKVQSGESTWSIAKKLNISVEDIAKANPKTNMEKLKVGQEIYLNIPETYLNVRTVETAFIEEKIPYETIFEETNTLYIGDKKIREQGIEGKKAIEVEIVKVNGNITNQKVIKEEIVKEPSKMIVLKGTKQPPTIFSSGVFSNPSRGRLTSRFGTRWGRNHEGIDVASPKGTEIKAAAKGTVVFSGTKSGYGKVIIIDHGNGFESYYAHCDTLKVNVGDKVEKGQIIATVGTTGRVTGPNLHFEIRKNGKPINPLEYVSY